MTGYWVSTGSGSVHSLHGPYPTRRQASDRAASIFEEWLLGWANRFSQQTANRLRDATLDLQHADLADTSRANPKRFDIELDGTGITLSVAIWKE